MKMKKVIALTLASAMVFGLAACGSDDKKSSESTTTDDTSDADKADDTAKSDDADKSDEADNGSGEEQTLKVAAIESAYGADMWHEVCEAFEKSHPGVTIELTVDKMVDDIIMPAMKAGDYPDVIMRAVGTEKAVPETFIKDNNIADLTDVLSMTIPGEDGTVGDKILPGFVENSITSPYGDGKTYMMPMFYAPCGLFYDANLLKAKGWDVPKTWDEMWALGDKAKAEGISLFTYPHAGYFDAFFYAMLHEAMGTEKFQKALKYEEGIWDTPEAQKVFDVIEKLASYTDPTTPANANENDFQKNQQLILDDKAIFMPNGNWVIGEMAEAPRAEGFEWGFTALPALEDGGESASYTFFEQIWMPKEAVNQDLGKEFIAYMYSDEAADIFAKTGGAVQPIAGMSDKLDGDAKLYYSVYDNGAVAVMDAFATTDPVEGVTVRTTFFDPVNSMVTGDKTKDQWVEQIKKDSDALRAALKE